MNDFAEQKGLDGSFGQCLRFLLSEHGCRPDGSRQRPGTPWKQTDFADAVGVAPRTINYWLKDEKLPSDIQSVERALFGASKDFDPWRSKLRAALQRTRNGGTEGSATEPAARPSAPQILHPDIRPVPSFTGRDALLAAIDRALWDTPGGGTAALTNAASVAAAYGLGGVAKTELAREYGWRNRARYAGVWWVRAETAQTIIDDLIDLGSQLIADLKHMPERDRAVQRALAAIAGQSGTPPWLIIYDNVEQPAALDRLTPRMGAQILITSRARTWKGPRVPLSVEPLEVDVFEPDAAADYLMQDAPPGEAREAALRLAEALGFLPLALAHARAYCSESRERFDQYRARIADRLKDDDNRVAATFSLAMDKVAAACPEAETLMAIAAFLAPDAIPLSLFTEDVIGEDALNKALRALYGASLITHETLPDGDRAFTVHRLVQEVMRSRLGESGQQHTEVALRLLFNALDAVDVREHVNWPRVATLVPHAVAILHLLDRRDEANVGALCNQLGRYFDARGDYATGTPYAERALGIAENAFGPDHPSTGAILTTLAGIRESQGRYAAAEPLYLRARAIAEKVLGPDHPHTGTSLNNLAQLYRNQGRYEAAEPLYLRALAITEKVLGPDHPSTATSLHNLADLYEKQGRYEAAEPLIIRALAIAEKALGLDHPSTVPILQNFANLYEKQSRYEAAEPLYLRALAIAEKVLGPDHAWTGTSLHNLANLYEKQSRYQEAEPLYLRAVEIFEPRLGPDHPNTKKAKDNYVRLLAAMAKRTP